MATNNYLATDLYDQIQNYFLRVVVVSVLKEQAIIVTFGRSTLLCTIIGERERSERDRLYVLLNIPYISSLASLRMHSDYSYTINKHGKRC